MFVNRVQPGECYHLYTRLQETMLQNYLPPEILRTRLEELCLQIKVLKGHCFNPIFKKAKTVYNFGLPECNKVKA